MASSNTQLPTIDQTNSTQKVIGSSLKFLLHSNVGHARLVVPVFSFSFSFLIYLSDSSCFCSDSRVCKRTGGGGEGPKERRRRRSGRNEKRLERKIKGGGEREVVQNKRQGGLSNI